VMRTVSPGISAAGLRVAIYTRVSTEDQADGHSLDYQRDACRAMRRSWAEHRGLRGRRVQR
jgi:hypothetical protein